MLSPHWKKDFVLSAFLSNHFEAKLRHTLETQFPAHYPGMPLNWFGPNIPQGVSINLGRWDFSVSQGLLFWVPRSVLETKQVMQQKLLGWFIALCSRGHLKKKNNVLQSVCLKKSNMCGSNWFTDRIRVHTLPALKMVGKSTWMCLNDLFTIQ